VHIGRFEQRAQAGVNREEMRVEQLGGRLTDEGNVTKAVLDKSDLVGGHQRFRGVSVPILFAPERFGRISETGVKRFICFNAAYAEAKTRLTAC
jgi:hypothetical protein